MKMNTEALGFSRSFTGRVKHQDQCPHVECCVTYGQPASSTGPLVITGMAGKVAQEVVTGATFWARLCEAAILQAARQAAGKLQPPLPAGRRLHVHLSPGCAAEWKDSFAGGAACAALASLLTGVPTRRDAAVTGQFYPPFALGGIKPLGQGVWANAVSVQGLRTVVTGRGEERMAEEAAAQGLRGRC